MLTNHFIANSMMIDIQYAYDKYDYSELLKALPMVKMPHLLEGEGVKEC